MSEQPQEFVKAEPFETARDFVDALRLTNQRWWPFPEQYLFRGQARAEWSLKPKAWRAAESDESNSFVRTADEHMREALRTKVSLTADEHVRLLVIGKVLIAEALGVLEFMYLADELGIPIPDVFKIDKGGQRRNMEQMSAQIADKHVNSLQWFFGDSHSRPPERLIALAQHHGVPTRLLDWTASPLIAAFFAAHFANDESTPPKQIAVWACNINVIESVPGKRIHEVRVSTQSNPFIRAQRGSFMLDQHAEKVFFRVGRLQCFEEIAMQNHVEGGNTPFPFRKLTLPFSECDSLLRILRLEGISKAHLMPTLDNVAKTVLMSGPTMR